MTRGLPVSILIHILTLGLILVFGNSVNQRQFEVPQTIGVRLVELPKVPLRTVEKVDPVEIAEQPKPKPEPRVQEELPPKELPKPKPDPKPEIKPEQPKEIIPPQEPSEETTANPLEATPEMPDAAGTALASGASVAGTDANFPFAWYLSVMEGQVARNWNPAQMGFRNNSGVSCVLHFTIQRSGAVSQVTLTRSSGIGVYDREALRAVQSTRLPQLPGDFGSKTLGVTMTFNLESGDR